MRGLRELEAEAPRRPPESGRGSRAGGRRRRRRSAASRRRRPARRRSAALMLAHLPASGAGATRCSATSCRRARQLATQPRDGAQVLRAHDADDVHAPAREAREPRARARAARATPRSAARASFARADHQRRGGRACPSGPTGSPGRRRWAARARDRAPRRAARACARSSSTPTPQRRRTMCHRHPISVRSSAAERRRVAAEDAVAARGAAAVDRRRAAELPQLRVAARPAMVDARRRDVADAPAGRAQPPLPVLLVAGAAERLVERPDPLERRRAGSPCSRPTRTRPRGPRGPRSSAVTGSGSRPHARRREPSSRGRIGPPKASSPSWREQRVEPARPDLDVVVEEAHELAGWRRDRGVARGVDARAGDRARRSARRSARPAAASAASSASSSTITISAPCSRGLRRDRGQRDRQIVARGRASGTGSRPSSRREVRRRSISSSTAGSSNLRAKSAPEASAASRSSRPRTRGLARAGLEARRSGGCRRTAAAPELASTVCTNASVGTIVCRKWSRTSRGARARRRPRGARA